MQALDKYSIEKDIAAYVKKEVSIEEDETTAICCSELQST